MHKVRSTHRGQSIVELVAGLIIVIPVLLVLIDCAFVLSGVQMADSTCREAARIAASGDPAQAGARIASFLAKANSSAKGMVNDYRLAGGGGVQFTPADIVQEEQSLLAYGGPLQGSVTVETEVNISPFALKGLVGAYSFKSSHTFPFTYVVPRQLPPDQ